MRWDYLHRFSHQFGEGGFKRMLREGFSCDNTFINHLPSATAVEHDDLQWIRAGHSWHHGEQLA